MVLGGVIGFGLGLGVGLAQQGPWVQVVWKACLSACVAGLLLRWWGAVWAKAFRQAVQQQAASEPSTSPDATDQH